MATVEIKDFKNGVDTRRPAIVGDPGSLIEGLNVHITRGGDVESRKQFTPYVTLPAGTFGLHSSNNKLYVFGSSAAPVNLPGEIVYQRLQHPSTANMRALLSSQNYDGKIYAIADFDDGSLYHYFNAARVTDWETKATAIAGNDTVATYLTDKIDVLTAFLAASAGNDITITAAVPGTAFTIAQSTTGTGSLTITSVQANQSAVAEVRAKASFLVTGGFPETANVISVIRAGVTDLISASVPYILDNNATALACATAINLGTGTHGYSAVSVGNRVDISAPVGQGATANGRTLTVTADAFVTVGSINNFAAGVTAVAAKPQIEKVTVGGTFAAANTYTVTLNGTNYTITGLSSGMGRIVRSFRTKMYSAIRALMPFSDNNDPTKITTGSGSGTINISSQDEGSQRLTAIGVYQGRLAVFARNTTQIWQVDPGPANNTFLQLLPNTGTRSPKAVIGYGNSDLIYLSGTGIRSLRARDSSNAAFSDDIGTRIDDNVVAFLNSVTDADIENAVAIVDPNDGRVWIAIKDRIYVFSFFPGSKISAWTIYTPGFNVDALAVADNRIYARSGDVIYIYGGLDNATYPVDGETELRVRLPFIDASRIAGGKKVEGVDLVCSGNWTVELLVDPNNEASKTTPIRVTEPTVLLGRIALSADTTHFAPLLTSARGGRHTFSAIVVHFDDTETT